jgi:hypothetical protein
MEDFFFKLLSNYGLETLIIVIVLYFLYTKLGSLADIKIKKYEAQNQDEIKKLESEVKLLKDELTRYRGIIKNIDFIDIKEVENHVFFKKMRFNLESVVPNAEINSENEKVIEDYRKFLKVFCEDSISYAKKMFEIYTEHIEDPNTCSSKILESRNEFRIFIGERVENEIESKEFIKELLDFFYSIRFFSNSFIYELFAYNVKIPLISKMWLVLTIDLLFFDFLILMTDKFFEIQKF